MSYETELEIGLKETVSGGLERLGGLLGSLFGKAGDAEKAIGKMIGAGDNFKLKAGEMEAAMRLVGVAAAGVAEIEIGRKMLGALDKAIDKAKELARIHNTLVQIGQGDQVKVYDEQARKLTGRFQNLSITELVKGMQEAGPIIGFDKAGSDEFTPIAEFMSTMKAKFGAEAGGEINRQVQAAVKAAEESGAMKPEDVARFLSGEQRMLFAFGEQVSPSSMLTVQRNMGAYQKDLDDHFRFGILPAMAINQGQRAGTELATTASKFVAGIRNSSGSLQEMIDLGILGREDVERNSKGQPVRIKVGHKTALADEMDKDPLTAVVKDLLPRIMAKYGDDPVVLKQAVGRLAGDKSAISGIVDLIINAQRYEKDAANVERVNPDFQRYREHSSDYAEQAVKAQRENIETAIGLPAVGPYTDAMNLFAKAEGAIGQAALSHPDLTKFASGILGIGGAAVQFAGVVTEIYAGFRLTSMLRSMKAEAEAAKKAAEDAVNKVTGGGVDRADARGGTVGDTARGAEAARAASRVAPEIAGSPGFVAAIEGGFAKAATDLGTFGMMAWWAAQKDKGAGVLGHEISEADLARNPLGIQLRPSGPVVPLPPERPNPVIDFRGNALRRHDDELSPVTAQELRRAIGVPGGHPADDDRSSRSRKADALPWELQQLQEKAKASAWTFGQLDVQTGIVKTSFGELGTGSGGLKEAFGTLEATAYGAARALATVALGGDAGVGGGGGITNASYEGAGFGGGFSGAGSGGGGQRYGSATGMHPAVAHALGLGSGSGIYVGSGGTDQASGAGFTAGMRARNLGNIGYFHQHTAGLIGPSNSRDVDHSIALFGTQEDGIRAAANLALHKYQGGRHSAWDLIAAAGGWTPGALGPGASVNIARAMGLSNRDDLHLDRPEMMRKFLHGLAIQEHGPAGRYYTPEMIDRALGNIPVAGPPARPKTVGPGRPAAGQSEPSMTTAMNMPPIIIEHHSHNYWDGKKISHEVTRHQVASNLHHRSVGPTDNYGSWLPPGGDMVDVA